MTELKSVRVSTNSAPIAGLRVAVLLSLAAVTACSGEAPTETAADEAIDASESAITFDLPPQPTIGCPDVTAAASLQLGFTQASVTSTSGPSYGTIPCNFHVVDVKITSSSSPPGLERQLTIDGFGVSRPPANASFAACSDYRETVHFYNKINVQAGTFQRIGGGRRHGVVRPLQIGPTGQIIPQHCDVVDDEDFDPVPVAPRCLGLCSTVRVAARAYSASANVERAVRVFVGNLPD